MIILWKEVQRRFAVLYDGGSLVASYAAVSSICEKLLPMLLQNQYQPSCFCIHSYKLHWPPWQRVNKACQGTIGSAGTYIPQLVRGSHIPQVARK